MQDPLSRPAPLLRAPGSLCPLLGQSATSLECRNPALVAAHLGVRWGIQPAPNKSTVPCTSSVTAFMLTWRG